MNIVHINTHNRGGAGNAALRLHQGLLNQGIDSHFLYLHGGGKKIKNLQRVPVVRQNRFKRNMNRLGFFPSFEQKNSNLINGLTGQYDFFSFPNTSYDLTEHPLVKQADIINLHWVGNFIDYPSFFKGVNKPIVWTLHDMNPFQGGFHYKDDVITNDASFGEIEKELSEVKKKSIKKTSNINVVTPSKWLLEESRSSDTLGNFNHHHIPNGLNTNSFKPYPQQMARDVFGLPQDKEILLFVSDEVNKHRKGFDLLRKAIKGPILENIQLCALGYDNGSMHTSSVISLGQIEDERLMPLAYSAADAFILPSREDNLPNTMLESIACGTPVISFPVGGMLDVVKDGFTGMLAKDISVEALRDAIRKFLHDKTSYDRSKIRDYAVQLYDWKVQAGKYIELYNSILSKGSI